MDTIESVIQSFENDYEELEEAYYRICGESLNTDPFDSIINFPMNECKYTVSIIIPSWNSADTLRYTLKSIEYTELCRRFNDQLEVVLVDDGSTDGTEDFIRSHQFDFSLLYIKQKHMGRPQGINSAIRNCKGKIIVFCDADLLLYPYTIDELVKRQQLMLNSAIFFGFREDMDYKDIPINNLEAFLKKRTPRIFDDNRFCFDYPGYWGSNMMLETNLLKKRKGRMNIWVSFGEKPIDDCWQFYRMVYGFLFSVSKENYFKVCGFDECMIGWGFDDTAFVAKCISKKVMIIPVPSAICLHIRHELRTANQWEEGRLNQERLLNRIRNNSFENNLLIHLDDRIISFLRFQNHKRNRLPNPNSKRAMFDPPRGKNAAKVLYNLGQTHQCIPLFHDSLSELTVEEIEQYFDAVIRCRNKNEYKFLCKNLNAQEFFYGSIARSFFDDVEWDAPIGRYIYQSYAQKMRTEDHLERAVRYFTEGQWYFALRDYYGAVICGDISAREKCDLCKEKLWQSV